MTGEPAVTAAVIGLVALTGATARRAWASGLRHRVGRRFQAGSTGHRRPLPRPPARVEAWIEDAGFERPPETVWWLWLAAVAVSGVILLMVGGPAAAVIGLAALGVAAALALRGRRGRGALQLERALPDALEAVARALRSGASLRQAVEESARATPGRLGTELGEVARQARHGAPLVGGLEALATRRPIPGVRLAVAALRLGVETGGAQARAIDGVAATLRDRQAVAAEVHALAAQARISALVIGVAPLAFGGFAMSTDPRTGRFLFHTVVGTALLITGLSLDAAGWLWMKRLARVAL